MSNKFEAAQMVPPATAITIYIGGITLENWLTILGIVLISLQILWFLWDKLLRRFFQGKEKPDGEDA